MVWSDPPSILFCMQGSLVNPMTMQYEKGIGRHKKPWFFFFHLIIEGAKAASIP
jgi:hypothetical protein